MMYLSPTLDIAEFEFDKILSIIILHFGENVIYTKVKIKYKKNNTDFFFQNHSSSRIK